VTELVDSLRKGTPAQRAKLDQLVQQHIQLVNVTSLGMYYHISPSQKALLLKAIRPDVLGRLIPLLLQMKMMNVTPVDLQQAIHHCCQGHASKRSQSSREDGPCPVSPEVQVVLGNIVLGLESSIHALWSTLFQSYSSAATPPLPSSMIHFEREVEMTCSAATSSSRGSPKTILHGRIDLSLSAVGSKRSAWAANPLVDDDAPPHPSSPVGRILIEFKCKSRPPVTADVLQTVLYHIMCRHHHILLFDVLHGRVLELALPSADDGDDDARHVFLERVIATTMNRHHE
jgi:hypothetical protein